MERTVIDEGSRLAGSQTNTISEVLAEKVGQQKYRIWFENSTRLTLTEDYLKIGVPNLFIAGWIERHFSNEIKQAVKIVTGGSRKISFAIDPELSGYQRRSQLDSKARLAAKVQQQIPQKQIKTQRAAMKRLKLSFDTFVVGSSNQLAYNAAKAVLNESKSPFNPLFIHGGYGVGKTHLLQGICNEAAKKRPGVNWMYLSAEDFANQFVLALKTKKLEAFRQKMRQTDLLAIDDIHFLASKNATQEEFLHTFNTIDLNEKQVVMASDAPPKMIGKLSEKLVNRFVSGMVVKIDNPDFHTRCEICKQYVRALRINASEGVIKYVAEKLRTNVRELEGALLKLTALASLQNEKISLSLTKEVLAEHLERCDPIVHISDIESAVATYFGITPADLHSSKKDRTVALARHFSMYLARKHTKMSFPEVGRCMGNKNHATVLLACKKIDDLTTRNVELHWHGPAGNKICKARVVLAHLEESISS